MATKSVLVRVPATVGSIAGAMNCAAVALDVPLNVKVTLRFDGRVSIRYFGQDGERVPRDRSNLVVQALAAALRSKGLEFAGGDFEIYSSVPVAVGLGSSTAAVLAGLVAADRLYGIHFGDKNLFDLASPYEDRSDSLRAAWLGGFVACFEKGPSATYRRVVVPENLALSVVVPDFSLVPGARSARGDQFSQPSLGENEVAHFKRARALAEFFNAPTGGQLEGFDRRFTCQRVVPGLEEALQIQAPGLQMVFVCGSGPAVGILTQGDPEAAIRAVRECFERHDVAASVMELRLSNAGARDLNATPADVSLPRAPALGPLSKKISLIPV